MKTWIDLLGTDTRHCRVDDSDIVRQIAPNYAYVILWTFESHEQAEICFREWIEECVQHENTTISTP